MQILYSVKKFWEDLKWADSDRELEVKKEISHDIYRFTMLYFDKLSEKVKNLEFMKSPISGIFNVPVETFIVIANFNKVSRESEQCVAELTKGLENFQTITENSHKYGEKAIYQLLEFTFGRTAVTVRKLLIEAADNQKTDDIAEKLIIYIEDILTLIFEDLSEKDIKVAKAVFWDQILTVFEDLIQVSIQRMMPPQFFSNLKQILVNLKEIFTTPDNEEEQNEDVNERIQKIEHILDCYGLNTSRLIHQYFKDRYELQLQIHKTPFNPYGMLTVFCYFEGNTLKLEILNARNLIPIGPNKKCDSFVKVSIAPKLHFSNFKSFKTKVHQNTHFPLYEESFELELTEDQISIRDAILCFNIKDKYIIGSDECIAEAFLSFRDIPEYSSKEKLQQIHLTLTRLQSDGERLFKKKIIYQKYSFFTDIESLKALKHRAEANDKDAKVFLSKLKTRTLISPRKLNIPITQL